ncbi:MAG TPA: hypothetical protein VME40_17140 [Caulobacteraceae bacterium]|nr:hypothetical protein [Caulobacteraceae bacterium]
MRTLTIIAAMGAASSLCGVAAAAPDAPAAAALAAKAEACIQSAAPAVAAQPGSLVVGVDFLVDDLCASDVEHYDTYQNSARLIEQLRNAAATPAMNYGLVATGASPEVLKSVEADAQAQVDKLTIDPQTGELIEPPDFHPSQNFNIYLMSANAAAMTTKPGSESNARFKAVAARALLAARTPPAH